MNNDSKYELLTKIEYILSYLLSKQHGVNVKISFKKENDVNGNTDKTGDISKK